MSTLIFIATVVSLLLLVARAIILTVKRQPAGRIFRIIVIIIGSYAFLWSIFYITRKDEIVPFGTNICFDDWCATVTGADSKLALPGAHGKFIILDITVSNHAARIDQKPSEPRVHILDDEGNSWAVSEYGENALAAIAGQQASIGERLAVGASLPTRLVFDVPVNARGLKVLIEEGPFITNFLFPENRKVFLIK